MGLFSDIKVNYIDRENFAWYGELSNPQRYWARDNTYQSGIVDELIKMSQTYNFDTIVKIDIGKPNFFGGVIKWVEFADRLGVKGITPEALYKSDLYSTSKVRTDSFFRPEGIKNINEKIIDRLIFLSTKEGTILPERAEPVIRYFKAFNKYNFN